MFQISRKVKASFLNLLEMLMKTNQWINQRLLNDCTPALKPNNFTQPALIGKGVRQETSQLPWCLQYFVYFLWNVCWFRFPHQKHSRGFQLQDKSEICSSVWLKEMLESTRVQYSGTSVVCAVNWWALALWGYYAEKRCGTSQLRLLIDETLNVTRSSFSNGAKLANLFLSSYRFPCNPALCVILHWRSCTVGTCPWQCALSG